ncbi:diiron oxygenase [Trichothermofontia sp.]
MNTLNYTYESILSDALKVNWKVSDLIGGDKRLDFSKPFLPDSLAGAQAIHCLSDREKIILNQIRGNSYLHLFGLAEEFILPMVIDQVRDNLLVDIYSTQALLRFAEEESKHIYLFQRFAEAFAIGFGSVPACIGPVHEIAAAVLQHSTLGVALLTLHIEWMTQRHYLESVQGNRQEPLDPLFASLLRHHWMEEAQHAKLDTLIVETLVAQLSPLDIAQGVDDYFTLVHMLDGGLQAQVQLDIASLEAAIGRSLDAVDKAEIQARQLESYRWAFLGSGMTHPNVIQTFSKLNATAQNQLLEWTLHFTKATLPQAA